MKLATRIIAILCVVMTAACSTSPKTQVINIGDNQLTEQQIVAELAKLDETERKINSNKGLTGTNVAAFLFWLPGLAYTYYDASDAMKLVEQRRSYLNNLYNTKYADRTTPSKRA